MTLVVPFDGSELAETALVRAAEFDAVFEEDVLVVSVVPRRNAEYARAREWVGTDEPFDLEAIVSGLRDRVTDLCPSAEFRHRVVDRYAPPGTISRHLREEARDVDASMVFVGSDNAGRIVTGLSSVGASVAADDAYDVVIVRRPSPSRISRLKRARPREKRE